MAFAQSGVEPVAGLKRRAHGEYGRVQVGEPSGDRVTEPLLREDVHVDVGRGQHEERPRLRAHPQFRPPRLPLLGHAALAPIDVQVLAAACLHPFVLGGGGLVEALVIDQSCLEHKHDGRYVHVMGVFQNPVIFPDVRGVRHVGGEAEPTVEDAVAVFLPVAPDRLQQVGDLVLPEILHLVPEDEDIGSPGERGGTVKGAETDVRPGVEDDRALVGDQFVERLPEMGLQPGRKVGLLRLGERGRLLLDDIVDSLAQSLALQTLQHGREDVGVQVRERVGHPDHGRARHVVDDVQKPFRLDVGRLGSAAPHDLKVLARPGQGHYLGERVLVLDGGRPCGLGSNSLPLHPQGILRCRGR